MRQIPSFVAMRNEVLGHFEGQVLNELPKVKERLAILETYTFPEYEQCMTIVDQCLSVAAIKELFAKPVEVENYSLWIQTPMDLGTVKSKLTGGSYTSFTQFERDMVLIEQIVCILTTILIDRVHIGILRSCILKNMKS